MDDREVMPPHEKIRMPGFHAYSQRVSVAPGGALDVRVSNDGPVQIQIVHLGEGQVERTPEALTTARPVADLGVIQAREQSICRGSYVHVGGALAPQPPFALELWCRVLAGGRLAGLWSQHGFYLAVDEEDRLVFALLEEQGWKKVSGPVLSLKCWHHVVGQCDGEGAELFVGGVQAGRISASMAVGQGPMPLRLGALENQAGEAAHLLTGDLCSPSLYDRCLGAQEISERYRQRALEPAPGCVGHWKFDALKGLAYRDISPSARHGRGINYPLRMIPGPRLVGEQPWAEYDPTTDSDFGHAVRLMADQVVDCGWPASLDWQVPQDLPSGHYAVRLENAAGRRRDLPFIVRPARPAAKLMCLSTTCTRIAYNYKAFGDPDLDYGAYLNHPVYPILGQLLGQRRPAQGLPYLYTVVNLELAFYAWLEQQGIKYDVYSEWDLEDDPSLLDHYAVVAWAGHSEYWTAARFEGLQRFRRGGGHLLSLSGNTAFWRVSIDRENGVVEVRKHGQGEAGSYGASVDSMLDNAHWHQLDHLPGTTMHTCGWPQFQLGLGMTNGWTSPCAIDGPRAGYQVLEADHPLFHQPRPISLDFPFAPGAAGYETDVACRSILERFGPTQRRDRPGRDPSLDLSQAACRENGPTVLARARIPDSQVFDYDLNCTKGELWSEMHWWEPPGQGFTFAAGSCMAALVLQEDENFSNFVLNVIERMGIRAGD